MYSLKKSVFFSNGKIFNVFQCQKYLFPHNFQTKPSFVAQLSRHNALEPRQTASTHERVSSLDPAITLDRITDYDMKLTRRLIMGKT